MLRPSPDFETFSQALSGLPWQSQSNLNYQWRGVGIGLFSNYIKMVVICYYVISFLVLHVVYKYIHIYRTYLETSQITALLH